MVTEDNSFRPVKVGLAVKMLYLVLGIGVMRTAITVTRHADVRSPDFLVGVKMAVYTISLTIIYQAGKGKNWARWSLVAILAICFPLIILPAFDAFTHNPVQSLLELLQLSLSLVALGFLFHGSSSGFFGKKPT